VRVRLIRFLRPVRTGPDAQHILEALDVTDDHFRIGVQGEDGHRVGTIDAYYGPGPEGDLEPGKVAHDYAIIRSPKTSRQTGELVITVVPLTMVVETEPLSAKMAATIYPAHQQAPDPDRKRPVMRA